MPFGSVFRSLSSTSHRGLTGSQPQYSHGLVWINCERLLAAIERSVAMCGGPDHEVRMGQLALSLQGVGVVRHDQRTCSGGMVLFEPNAERAPRGDGGRSPLTRSPGRARLLSSTYACKGQQS